MGRVRNGLTDEDRHRDLNSSSGSHAVLATWLERMQKDPHQPTMRRGHVVSDAEQEPS